MVGSATRQDDVDDAVAAIEDAIDGLKEEQSNEPVDPPAGGGDDPVDPPAGGDNNTQGGDTTEEKKGCGSSITLAGVAMIAAFGAAAVAVAKKKED